NDAVIIQHRVGNSGGSLFTLTRNGPFITAPDADLFSHPRWNPGKTAVVYKSASGGVSVARPGSVNPIVGNGSIPTWTHTGHVVYQAGGDLWAANADGTGAFQMTFHSTTRRGGAVGRQVDGFDWARATPCLFLVQGGWVRRVKLLPAP